MTHLPNIIHVTVDSLRADYCGFLNNDCDLTQTLDRLADRGTVFENAYAPAGSTRASSASFLTGRYPHSRPTADTTRKTTRQHFAAEETLPERLSRLGYETAIFTANPNASRYYIEEEIVDRFEDQLKTLSTDGENSSAGRQTNALSRIVDWWRGQDMFMTWEAIYDDITEWIANSDTPYYCWIFLVDPHMPYLPPSGYRTHNQILNYLANAAMFADTPGLTAGVLRDAYRDSVRYTDAFFDRLRDDVDDAKLVIHADHGEVFGKDGAYGHGDVYEAILHVPLIVAGGPATRVSDPVSLCTLPEMVTDLVTQETFNPESYAQPFVRARLRGPERVLRGHDWKYVRTANGDQVYRLEDGEPVPVDAPELRECASSVVDAWREAIEERCAVMAASDNLAETEQI